MSRKIGLAVAFAFTAALAGSGCDPEPTPPTGAVVLAWPTDGSRLSLRDDVDAEKEGLQIDVRAAATGFAVDASAKVDIDGGEALATVTVSGNALVFPAVTLPAGSHVLQVTVSDSEQTVSAQVGVVVDDSPLSAGVELRSPRKQLLNKADDLEPDKADLQTDVEVVVAGLKGGSLRVCLMAPGLTGTACDKGQGFVVAEEETPADGKATFRVTLPEGVSEILTAEHKPESGDATASTPLVLTVDSIPPEIRFLSPDQDATLTERDFQVVTETDAEEGQTVELKVDGDTQTAKVDYKGEAGFEVSAEKDGELELTATVTDKAGNASEPAVLTVQVDTTACPLSMLDPSQANPVFGAAADLDKDASNGLQIDVVALTGDSAAAPGECTGRTAELFVGGLKRAEATADAASGELRFPGVTLPDGASDLQVEVRLADEAGNLATAGFLATVMLTGPKLTLHTDPGPRNLLNDKDFSKPGVQVQVLVGATLVQGGEIYLCSTVPAPDLADSCKSGGHRVTPKASHETAQTTFYGVTLGDGRQALTAEVFDGAGNLGVSEGVELVIDSVPPKVLAFQAEQDGNPKDGYLNAAELPSGAKARFALMVQGADDRPIDVYLEGSALPAASGKVAPGGAAAVEVSLGEGKHKLLAKVVSANGNPNVSDTPAIADPGATLEVTVRRTGAVLTVVAPNEAYLNKADDKDGSTADLDYELVVATDAAGGQVEFFLDGSASPQTAPVESGRARLNVTLGQGPHEFVAKVKDIAGNETTAESSFQVDTAAPTIAFVKPTPGQSLESFTVAVEVKAVGAEAGQRAVISSSAAGEIGSKPVDGAGLAAFSVLAPGGAQKLTARIADLAGNEATDSVDVTVSVPGCSLGLVNPSKLPVRYGASHDKDAAAAGAQVDIEARTLDCKGREATLAYSGKTFTATADAATGSILFKDLTFPDGASDLPVAVTLANEAGTVSRLDFQVSVKLSAPTLKATPAVPADGGTLYLVAKGHPAGDDATHLQDTVPDDLEADVGLKLEVVGAVGGTLTITFRGEELARRAVAATPENFGNAAVPISLPHGTSGDLEVVLDDGFANVITLTYPTVVDVVPPAAPQVAAEVSEPRKAEVKLSWKQPGDDADQGSVAGYEVRYRTSTQAKTSLNCPTLGEADWASAVAASGAPQGGAAGLDVVMTAAGLPPLNCYALAVRARDEVGNLSPIAEGNVATVRNYWKATELAGDAPNSLFGFLIASGDLNGDGKKDLVTSARVEGSNGLTSNGAVYVYYGPDFPASSRVKLTGQTASEQFGYTLAVGDVNKDGVDDLLTTAPFFKAGTEMIGRAFLYFGRKGASLDPTPIEFRGRVALGMFGYAAGILEDVNHDGYKDVVIGAPQDPPGTGNYQGHSFLFFGRERADWEADRTDCATGIKCIAAANSSERRRVFVGSAATEYLGSRGYASLGDLDNDGYFELSVPASRDTVNKLYLFNGKAVADAPAASEIDVSTGVVLSRPKNGSNSLYYGFGSAVVGGVDFDGDRFPDLVVSHPIANDVILFKGDPTARAITTTPAKVINRGAIAVNFGAWLSSADLNDDGLPDLAVGNVGSDPSLDGGSSIWFFFNAGGGDPLVDAGSILKLGNNTTSVELADFDGDGKPEVAMGDNRDGNGKVRVYAP